MLCSFVLDCISDSRKPSEAAALASISLSLNQSEWINGSTAGIPISMRALTD
jgi:hypothetical protein